MLSKKAVWGVLVSGLLLVAVLAGAWMVGQPTSPVLAQATDTEAAYSPVKTITVVGQGSVRLQPDIARVSVGVETKAATVSEAVADNEAKMKAVLEALAAEGIREADIQTMNYSIQLENYGEPMPREGGSEQASPQYRVSNMADVTVRDLDKVGDVLDAVVEAGANSMWGVSFSLDDPEAAQEDARAKAVTDARSRAEALAELSDVGLGPVMSLSEVVAGGVIPVAVMAERAMGGGGPISPGEVEVSYSLQVVYYIEPGSASN